MAISARVSVFAPSSCDSTRSGSSESSMRIEETTHLKHLPATFNLQNTCAKHGSNITNINGTRLQHSPRELKGTRNVDAPWSSWPWLEVSELLNFAQLTSGFSQIVQHHMDTDQLLTNKRVPEYHFSPAIIIQIEIFKKRMQRNIKDPFDPFALQG